MESTTRRKQQKTEHVASKKNPGFKDESQKSNFSNHIVWSISCSVWCLNLKTFREVSEIDRKSKNLLIMHGAHHHFVDTERLFMEESNGERQQKSMEDWMHVEHKRIKRYLT